MIMTHALTIRQPLIFLAAIAALMTPFTAQGALTDVADNPLASSSSTQVKPNILFTLDDSGSMAWEYMPDDVGSYTNTVGFRNNQCNLVYYNPNIAYVIPKTSTSSDVNTATPATFTAAYNDGFYSYDGASSSATNLSSSFKSQSSDTAQPGYYWTYLGGSTLTPLTGDCQKTLSSSSDSTTQEICTDNSRQTTTCAAASKTALWRKVLVSATSGPSATDERQNFANWYSYYRYRLNMMKSAAGRVFVNLSDSYRVGFITINPGSPVATAKFLTIADFDTTQKANWFTKFYSQTANSSTPLRTALSRAGRYFAGKTDGINQGMSGDPLQYSCQQNFTILTTDGYWNGTGGAKLNGTIDGMDNQDGNIAELDAYNPAAVKFAVSPRPIFDGATALYTWNTASNQYRNTSCVLGTQEQRRIAQNQRRRADFYKCRSDGSSCQSLTFDCAPPTGTGSGTRPLCKTLNDTGWANIATCTAGYSSPTTTLCRTTSDTGWVDVASCTASSPIGGPTTTCQTVNINGYKAQYQSTTTATNYAGPNQSGSVIGSPTTNTSSWTDVNGACLAAAPAVPPTGTVTGVGPPAPPASCLSGVQEWPCETQGAVSGGSSNTLSDVAQYYYKTDLRTATLGNCSGSLATDVCENNVPSTGAGAEDDKAQWQHMTTFTMGLGLSGTLSYSPTYKTDTTGTFANIRAGSINWPLPVANDPTALDDLWHTAVDGRGQYFSAGNPDTVVTSLTAALAGVSARLSSAAAAATSNLEPVAGDNFAYTAKYVTQKWTGELEAHEIVLQDEFDPVTHALTASAGTVRGTVVWSAQGKLDTQGKAACDTRNIKLFRTGAVNNLVPFTWNTFGCDASGNPTGAAQTSLNAAEQANFGSTQIGLLSQYPSMTDGVTPPASVNQRGLAAGANLVNFLRGQRGLEDFVANDANQFYRLREHILGDIINAQPVYAKAPFAEYDDAGYLAFKTTNASRTPMVYAAANDGMLHAFNAGASIVDTNGGTEAWAFIPTMVLPNLYKLASVNYASQHTYSVDGTPTIGDVYDTADTAWKTILVGGLNKGGKGYYALDITDPASPKGLWEFKNSSTCYDAATPSTWFADCHIGYTFNNPIISKLRDGRWVVFVTSGYNNVNSPSVSGDGVGYLYVLEAATGKILYKISTGVGSATTPSGLNKINAWVENPIRNNQAERVYGVDLLGNVWRFDVNDILAPAGIEATKLATLVDSANSPQSITTRPELAEVAGQPYVYVGTGRYLGTTDNANTQTQSIWALADPLAAAPLTNLRTTLKQMTITDVGSGTTAFRTIGCTAQCGSTTGWFADFPDTGERVNIDIKLQLGTLVVATNVPQNNACNIGGYSWLNYFNNATGNAVSNSPDAAVGRRLVGADGTESLAVGINIVRLPGGKVVVIATTSAAQQLTVSAPFDVPPPTGKRISWREIIQ
jgi:Tfp pilus tip-associated adhesin PilY1